MGSIWNWAVENPLVTLQFQSQNPKSDKGVEIIKIIVFSLEQTRDALLKILQDLHPEDHFGFITFNNKVVKWKSSLLPATQENVASAAALVQTLTARGGTRACSQKMHPVEKIT